MIRGVEPLKNQPMEDYLAAIYRTQLREGKASTSEVARILGVTPASTSAMFKKLAEKGLVDYKGYVGAALNPDGIREALTLIRRHRLIERFLTEVLGFTWDQVDDLADEMEHACPEAIIERFEAVLGMPRTCPHGFPIPRADGTIPDIPTRPLDALKPGDSGAIAQVSEYDPELLVYLAEQRLVPGTAVKVIAINPLDAVRTLEVEGNEVTVGERITAAIALAAE